jgi:uncharacterized protein (TIGR03545 family)
MTQWIRWQGLAAFVIFSFILALVWLVGVDWMVEKGIEVAGTRAVGAKVEVADVDVTLFPAGVAISGLAVTDPDQPMRNSVEIIRLKAALELPPLFKRKIIIDEVRVQGLRFNTPRQRSGALGGKTASKDPASQAPAWLADLCGTKGFPQLSLPTADEILGREPLQTLQMATQLRSQVTAARADWEKRLTALPDQQRLASYQTRIDKVKGAKGGLGDLLGSAAKAQAIATDLQKDIKQIQKAQETFKSELSNLKTASSKLADAPGAEVKRLMDKYALNPAGVANLSRLLFGRQVCGWWQKGYGWYQRFKPYLSRLPAKAGAPEQTKPLRSKGVDVHFKEQHPLPDFLIRQVHVDAQLDVGEFSGQMANITSQPQILGAPLTYQFLGRKMKQMAAFDLNGVMDLIRPEAPRHSTKLLIQQFALHNLLLGDPEQMPISIVQAMTDVNFDFSLKGNNLNALLKAQLDQVQIAVQQTTTSTLAAALGEALSATKHFGLTATLKGTAPEIQTRLQSDLDQILQKAVGQMVQKASAGLTAQLQQTIDQKTKGAIGDVQADLASLDDIKDQLTQRLKLGNNLLKKIKLP